MAHVEEVVYTKAPTKKVWDAWTKMHLMNLKDPTAKGIKEGQKGFVQFQKTKIPYSITQVDKNKSYTVVWHARLVKLSFLYEVFEEKKGSKISCSVTFKGLFGFLVKYFLKTKMQNELKSSLPLFAQQLEMHR